VITVSHDRYFLDNVADRIFAFENGHLVQYEGGYTDYLEAKKNKGAAETDHNTSGKEQEDKNQAYKEWKQNRPSKLKFSYKEQKEYESIDEDIAALEEKIESLNANIMANATNSGKLNELMAQKSQAETELEEKMERWVYLNDLAERIEEQKNT